MSLLADRDIKTLVRQGRLTLDPWQPAALQPASYDVTLGATLLVPHARYIRLDPTEPIPAEAYQAVPIDPRHGWSLRPHGFVLAPLAEWLELPDDIAARIEGRSSLGRLGLQVHATAGYADPGYRGRLTLEIHNVGPWAIVLRAGQGIAQLAFWRLSSAALRPYGSEGLGSRYQAAQSVEGSKGVARVADAREVADG